MDTDPEKRGDRDKEARVGEALSRWSNGNWEDGDIECLRDAGFDVRRRGTEIHLRLWDGSRLREERAEHSRARRERRAMSTSATAGGDTIPQTLIRNIEVAMLDFGGMRDAGCNILRTEAGEQIDIPTSDDTGNAGALLAENTQVSEQDIATAAKAMNAYKYTSKLVRVSNELIADAAVDIPAFVGEMLGIRVGRIVNQHLTTGTGSSQPNGVVTAGTIAATTASPTTVKSDELITLMHSVDPAYRRERSVGWMFSDQTLKVLKQLKDGDGRPLWQSGLQTREPDSLLGFGYTINQDVADIASAAKAILFGAFRYYWIRDVTGVVLRQLEERYADYDQVGFVMFSRRGGLERYGAETGSLMDEARKGREGTGFDPKGDGILDVD